MTAPPPVSGTQHRLRAGDYEARIAGVGATLRSLRYRDRDLILPFAADEVRPELRGALLVPWPNRLAEGEYAFAGRRHALPITEPDRGVAAHGLALWLDAQPVESSEDRLTLRATIEPQPGYPWRLRIDASFSLDGDGLSQEVVVTNESDAAAPIAIGGHPYLLAGPSESEAVDDWVLTVPAERALLVSDDRLLPTELVGVGDHDGGRLDFRRPRRIGPTAVNNAYTGLRRTPDGLARVRLVDGAGTGVELEWDARSPWVQLYTADAAGPSGRRHAVAVEPMTSPPDAFNSGLDLPVAEPGGSVGAGWRIRAIDG